jgi:hypothetical protein
LRQYIFMAYAGFESTYGIQNKTLSTIHVALKITLKKCTVSLVTCPIQELKTRCFVLFMLYKRKIEVRNNGNTARFQFRLLAIEWVMDI